jgi:hypothetical protein
MSLIPLLRLRSRPLVFFPLMITLLLCQSCSDNQMDPLGDFDPDAPFAVKDLAIVVSNDTTRLTWTATGDNGPNGTATRYDLRTHPDPINTANWASATPVQGVTLPQAAGSRESFDFSVNGDPPTVFLALNVYDDMGNASGLSNVVFLDLQPPAAVVDLAAERVLDQAVILTWTAPADDNQIGHPSRYEFRISKEALTSSNWGDILPRFGPHKPLDAGQTEKFALSLLSPLTHYYLALWSLDELGNLSEMSNVIEFDTTETPVGWWEGFSGLGADGIVRTFHSLADTLYAGGRFTQVGALSTSGVAAWDGANWSDMGGGLSGGQYGTQALDIEYFNGALYLAGSFYFAGDMLVSNFARWTGSGWESPGNTVGQGIPISLGVYNGDLFIGWIFNQSSVHPFNYLDRYDGTSFHSMGWNQTTGTAVNQMLNHKGLLVIAGGFGEIPGSTAESVVMWDGANYTVPQPDLVGKWDNPFITASCEYEGDLILGGDFTSADGVFLNHIARWDGSTWHPLGSGFSGDFVMVTALTVYRGYLVAGGSFETAGGDPANNIAIWDGTYWAPLGEGLEGGIPGVAVVQALAEHAGSLYVGGNFQTAGELPSVNIARWDLD